MVRVWFGLVLSIQSFVYGQPALGVLEPGGYDQRPSLEWFSLT